MIRTLSIAALVGLLVLLGGGVWAVAQNNFLALAVFLGFTVNTLGLLVIAQAVVGARR